MPAAISLSVSLDFESFFKVKIWDSHTVTHVPQKLFFFLLNSILLTFLNLETFPLISLILKISNKPEKQRRIFKACYMAET